MEDELKMKITQEPIKLFNGFIWIGFSYGMFGVLLVIIQVLYLN